MQKARKSLFGHRRGRVAPAARFSVAVLAVVVAGLVGLMGSANAQVRKAAAKPVLHVALPYSYFQFYSSLAATAGGNSGAFETSLAYLSLYHMLPNGKVVGQLAASGHYFNPGNGAQKGYQVTLIHNAKFSDGTPVNAAAVVGWMNFYMKQRGGSQTLFGATTTFTAVGNWTVSIVLANPVKHMPAVLSDAGSNLGTPASPACIATPALLKTTTCGSGPYMLDTAKTVPNSSYVYVPNPHYYAPKTVKFSGVVDQIIPVPSTALAGLQSGQLDVAYVGADSSTVPAAKSAGLKVVSAPVGAYQVLLNENDPHNSAALKDARVRQALSYGINRSALAQLIAPGGYAKATAAFPQTDITLSKKDANPYTYNPTKAKALLAAAGYPNGITLNIALIQSRTQDQQMFGGLAQELKASGITLNPVNFTSPASIFTNAGFLLTTIANTTQIQYAAWIAPKTPVATWPVDPKLVSLYQTGLTAKNGTSSWEKMWAYEGQQSYFLTICTVSGIWYVNKKITGVNVPAPRVGGPLISEISRKG